MTPNNLFRGDQAVAKQLSRRLTDVQLDAAIPYMDTHRNEVEAEYQEVLKTAQEIREYWEEKNRQRFAQIAQSPPKPGQEAIRAKLQAHKAKLGIM